MIKALDPNETLSADDWLLQVLEAERAGDYLVAYDRAQQGLAAHPGHMGLKHRAVLALARSGATQQARELFLSLRLADSQEEDVAALYARLAKDDALAADGAERATQAQVAGNLYKAIYERHVGYYPGINAATLHLLAGKPDEAARLARGVLEICVKAAGRASGDEYYLAATEAEAYLLLDDLPAVRDALQRAAGLHGGDYASVATTRKQLRIICEIKGVEHSILEPLESPPVIHYVGHMIAGSGKDGRFTPEMEGAVASRIVSALAVRNVGYGFGSLACGADVLFAEALLKRGAELHLVLPFDNDEFKDISVAPGGPSWVERFERCLARARRVTYATEDSYLGDDELFAYAGRMAMGLARLRAIYLDTEVSQIAVWDGQPAQGPAGTAVDVAFWQERGFETEVIDCGPPARGAEARAAASAPSESLLRRVVRAMLFGDVRGFSKLREAELPRFVDEVMGGFAKVLDRYGDRILYRNTWGDAVYVVLPDAITAARCALDLQAAMDKLDTETAGLPSYLALRMGGHFGPVFEGRDPVLDSPAFFGSHVSRTARIEPVTPPGQVYVTEPFAAALALEPDAPFTCEYVGHMPAAKDYGTMRMYVVRQRM